MTDSNTEVLTLLKEMRDLLIPVSAYYEEQYDEIKRRRGEAKAQELTGLLTSKRRQILPLLFDPRRLTQSQIATEAQTTQPTVSRFIEALLERGLVEQGKGKIGVAIYRDRYGLTEAMEELDE